VQAALQRGQIGVTAGQLLKELGYTDEEISLMLGDKASQPPPAPTKGGAGGGAAGVAPPPAQRATAALVKAIAPGADGGATANASLATPSRNGTATKNTGNGSE